MAEGSQGTLLSHTGMASASTLHRPHSQALLSLRDARPLGTRRHMDSLVPVSVAGWVLLFGLLPRSCSLGQTMGTHTRARGIPRGSTAGVMGRAACRRHCLGTQAPSKAQQQVARLKLDQADCAQSLRQLLNAPPRGPWSPTATFSPGQHACCPDSKPPLQTPVTLFFRDWSPAPRELSPGSSCQQLCSSFLPGLWPKAQHMEYGTDTSRREQEASIQALEARRTSSRPASAAGPESGRH